MRVCGAAGRVAPVFWADSRLPAYTATPRASAPATNVTVLFTALLSSPGMSGLDLPAGGGRSPFRWYPRPRGQGEGGSEAGACGHTAGRPRPRPPAPRRSPAQTEGWLVPESPGTVKAKRAPPWRVKGRVALGRMSLLYSASPGVRVVPTPRRAGAPARERGASGARGH